MALQADGVYAGAVEKTRIRPAVRGVARRATLGFYDAVLIDKRASCFRVALDTNSILLRDGREAILLECPVGIVAIGTLNQSLVDLVMEGHGELRLHIGVALIAERRLGRLQQGFFLASMNVVATDTAYVALGMSRAIEVPMLALMAAKAFGIDLFAGGVGGVEDPGSVTVARHVCAACAMAVLTAYAGLPVLQSQLAMRVIGESFGNFLMAGGANLGTDEVSGGRSGGLRNG